MRIGISLALTQPRRASAAGFTFTNAEASALVARFSSSPNDTRKGVIDTLVGALKSGAVSGSNIFAKLDVLYLLAAHDAQAAQRNWIQDAFNLAEVASPTFTADRGYAGNGSSSYLTTGYRPGFFTAVATQNSAHLGVWSRTNVDSTGRDGGSLFYLEPRNAGSFATRINTATTITGVVADSLGHFVAVRPDASNLVRYKGGASLGSGAAVSSAPIDSPLIIGARNGSTTNTYTPGQFSTRQISAFHAGSALTANEVTDIYNALAAYHTAVGA